MQRKTTFCDDFRFGQPKSSATVVSQKNKKQQAVLSLTLKVVGDVTVKTLTMHLTVYLT